MRIVVLGSGGGGGGNQLVIDPSVMSIKTKLCVQLELCRCDYMQFARRIYCHW